MRGLPNPIGRPRIPKGPCRFAGCPHPVTTKGWCDGHYRQLRSGNDLGPVGVRRRRVEVRNEARLVGNLCQPHKGGLPSRLEGIAFYVAGCLTCEKKRSDGKLTGNEPPPPTLKEQLAERQGKARRLANLRIKVREPEATL